MTGKATLQNLKHRILTRSSAIAERPRCSLFKLWQNICAKSVHLTLLYVTALTLTNKSNGNSVAHAHSFIMAGQHIDMNIIGWLRYKMA